MFRTFSHLTAVVVVGLLGFTVNAAQFGTRNEAVAMVKRVQEKFRKDGAEVTFRAVTAKAKQFHDRDLYPFIYDLNGVNVAHGARTELVGKDLIDFKDQNGKFLIREMVGLAKGAGSGWVDYRWTNPMTMDVEDKSAYVEKMGEYFVGVGVYKTEQVNENTVGIISGSPNSDDTYLQIAYDLAAVLNDGNNFRILPTVGIGGPQNIRDVRYLKGIDIGLTQTSILNNFRRSNEQLGVFDDRLVYIAKLFNEEIHVVARADVNSLEQLRGQKVNLDEKGSGTNYSMRDVVKRLAIGVEEVNMTQVDAFEQLKAGAIAATVLIAGKPARSMTTLKPADGLHFLPIPYSSALGDDYLPTKLTNDDYPAMIPPNQSIDTLAVGAVLIAYNWPKNTDRYQRVEKFVNAFFPRIAEFNQPPRHIKWHEVNLASTLPGWTRFEPAQAWLDSRHNQAISEERSKFNKLLVSSGIADSPAANAAQGDQLFEEFMKWRRARQGR
jgi:TRAP-type uncharacterized transport system substrate-binding protein